MAFSTAQNHKKFYHRGIVFLMLFIFLSPGFAVAQSSTSLPQNFARSIFCTINDLLGIKSCEQSVVLPNPDLVAGVSFIPSADEARPPIIQYITQPVIERSIHTKEIIKQVLPEKTLAQFSRQLEQLSQNLYQTSSSAFDDTDLWKAIALMNAGGVNAGTGSSTGSGDQSLAFNSGTSILTISDGNAVDLSALSGGAGSDDQILSAATYNAGTNELSISIENGNTVTIDLSDLIDDADANATNEIQSLSLIGDNLSLSGTSTTIDLSPYLDNIDTLSDLNCTSNEIAKWNGSAWGCSVDASGTGGTDDQTIDSFSLSANIISLSLEGDGEAVKTIDLTAYVNTDTQLNEAQVDSFVSDNGYLTSETDGSITNEIQALALSSNILSLSGTSTPIDLSIYLDDTDTKLNEAEVDNYVANNGYLTVETDNQTIDVFSLVGDTLSLSLEGDGEADKIVDLSSYAKDTDLHDAITLSGAFNYLTLVGQDIVRGAIDLASDITGTLSIGNGGTGATTTALARSNLGLAIGANIQAFDSDTSLIGQTIETTEISNGTILGADLNLTDITLSDFTNDQSFITDGNSNWDNSYGFITSANDTVSGSELDGVFTTTGLLTRTGAGTYSTITNNTTNWNTAFGWGDHSGQGYLTGITGQSIITLSDVYSSMVPTDGQVLTFDTTNGWQSEDAGGGALFTDAGTGTYLTSLTDNLGIGTTTPTSLLHLVSAADAAIGLQTNITVSGGGTETFNYTGGEQTWVVPVGVTSITVDASGARGGGGGGNGGRIEVSATTTPGETLYIYVGSTSGYNGGGTGLSASSYGTSSGGGGGASDIRQIGNAIGDRIVVAGGGGGKGGNYADYGGGGGGAGGGFGGGGNGGGGSISGHTGSGGGSGGSGSGSGGGGTGTCAFGAAGGGTGGSGSSGVGGAGGSRHADYGTGGGGGGGGYNGGGGGGGGCQGGSGGGGGGSSYPSTATHTTGYQSGDGQVIITYTSSGTEDVDWTLGTDQSQEGFFKIAASTALGTSDLLTIDTDGNVGIGTNAPTYPLHMASGAHVTAGGSWTNASSRDLKENFVSLNPADILISINTLDIPQWNYKAEDASILHIGPIAQDFFAEFALGGSDVSISTIDTAGVALIGIQALSQKFDNLFAGFSITENGKLIVSDIEADNIKTDELEAKTICLGSTCITETALRDLLDLKPLSDVSNVLNDPADNTDFMEENSIADEAELFEESSPSTAPLSEEPDPIEQATSTIEKTIQQEIIEEENQTLDEIPIDVPVEFEEQIVEEPLSKDQADETEILKLQVSEPEPINQTPLIDNPQAGDNAAVLIN